MLSTYRFVLSFSTFKIICICIWSLYICFKCTLSLKLAINSGHWLGFPSKVKSSIEGNCRDCDWACNLAIWFAKWLIGNNVSSSSTSLSVTSSIGSDKGFILSGEFWSFVFSEIFGVSRKVYKRLMSLKNRYLSLLILLWLRSTLGKFLTLRMNTF